MFTVTIPVAFVSTKYPLPWVIWKSLSGWLKPIRYDVYAPDAESKLATVVMLLCKAPKPEALILFDEVQPTRFQPGYNDIELEPLTGTPLNVKVALACVQLKKYPVPGTNGKSLSE